jgi:hypothetical protein
LVEVKGRLHKVIKEQNRNIVNGIRAKGICSS